MIVKDIIKPTVVCTAVALACVYALSHVQKITGPEIIKRIKEKQDTALNLVLPGFTIGEKRETTIDGKEFIYWEAEKKEGIAATRAYAFLAKSPGYAGDVDSMVGVDEKGTILGISIISQTETPGLGARCVEVAGQETLWDILKGRTPHTGTGEQVPFFQEQFKGLTLNSKINILKLGDWTSDKRESLLEKNGISALTGATITTTAVVRGVESGMMRLNRALEESAKEQPGGAR
ncbi:MAG: FMN-binding protein [Spirochaetes bacterium]|nr:FMN-binding protein [Spirochaetota bacterium]